jgi:hypothetical protein
MTSNLRTLALDGARPVLVHYMDRFRRSYSSAGLSERAGSARAFVEGWRLSPAADLPISSAESLIKS